MQTNNDNTFINKWLLITLFLFSLGAPLAYAAEDFTMPFNLAMAPDTRVIGVAEYFVGEIKEANGSLATKGTAKDAVKFYEDALTEAGFRIFSKTDNAKRVSIAAKRGKGDFFSISNFGDDDGLEPGETKLTITIRFASE